MAKKLSYEYIKNFIENAAYQLINTEYVNNKTKLDLVCPNNHSFQMTWNHFRDGSRCPQCKYEKLSEKFRFDYDYVKYFIEVESNSGFKLISTEYKNNSEKLHMKCPNNHDVYITFSCFRNQGIRCKECSGLKQKTTDVFKKEVFDLVGDEYTVLGEYKNTKTKILMRHEICKTEYEVSPCNFLAGKRCPKCAIDINANNKRLNYQYVYDFIKNEGFVLLSKTYKNAKQKLNIKCSNGHLFQCAWDNFLNSKKCPICSESQGEKKILKFLKSKNILYETQKKFRGLIGLNGGLLSYDFYLPDYNWLIEYQGEFHDGNGNYYVKQNLAKQQEHDRRKREYAKKHNIKLIEIWYYDFDNIEQILDKELQLNKKLLA